jgi:hypothetical protein
MIHARHNLWHDRNTCSFLPLAYTAMSHSPRTIKLIPIPRFDFSSLSRRCLIARSLTSSDGLSQIGHPVPAAAAQWVGKGAAIERNCLK